jgi:hypothetical protein
MGAASTMVKPRLASAGREHDGNAARGRRGDATRQDLTRADVGSYGGRR